MKSFLKTRTRFVATLMWLALLVMLASSTALAHTASAAKSSVDNAAPAGVAGCAMIVAPLAHVVTGESQAVKTFVSLTGQDCHYGLSGVPNWIKITNVGSSPVFMTPQSNLGPARTATIKIHAYQQINGHTTSTGIEFNVVVTQQTLVCTYDFDKTVFTFPNGAGSGNIEVDAIDPDCLRNAKSNSSWLTVTSGSQAKGDGIIGFALAQNQGPARTGKITLGNATATFTQGGGCYYDLATSSKTFDSPGGNGVINVTASHPDCSREFKSNAAWLTVTGGQSSTGSGPVTYSVAPNPGGYRTADISRAGSLDFSVTQNGACTYVLSPTIFNFQGGNGASQIQVTASSASCTWSPQSAASWVKITSPGQVTGSANVTFTVDANPNATSRNTTITIGNKTATINQAAGQPIDCAYTVSPMTQQIGVGGAEFTVNVAANKDTCKWYILNVSPFVQVVNIGSGNTGNASFKLKVLPNPGATRSGSAEIAGKTITINQDGTTPQTLLITELNPDFATAGSPELLLIVKGVNFTNACKVRWNGTERFTSYHNSSTLGAIISPSDIANEGLANISVVNSGSGMQSNVVQFHIYGPLTNVSSASYKGEAIAPDSLVSGFGSDLAQTLMVANGWPLPTELEGTTVSITDASGAEHQAQIFFVSGNQVNYYMPANVALGKATVTIKSGSGHISGSTVNIEPVAPGLFSVDSTGKGLGAILAVRVKANGQQIYEQTVQFDANAGVFKAVPIDLTIPGEVVYLAIFGTGFRNRTSLAAVKVSLDGIAGTAAYAGETPGYLGLDQINLIAPAGLAGRGEIDIKVTVDGKVANTVKLAFK